MRILSEQRELEILRHLLECGSISGASRITGSHRDTCCRVMARFGRACKRFMDEEMRDLVIDHVQLDEIKTFCRKKQKNLTELDQQDQVGEFWLYIALDEATRLIPCFRLDKRNQLATTAFVQDLYDRLTKRKPHESDDHAYTKGEYRPITRISTDGLPQYQPAISAVFGAHATHGILEKKITGPAKAKVLTIEKKSFGGQIDPKLITTSLVERSNLTTRTFMKRLVRRTCCFSKKLDNFRASAAMHLVSYNYCRKIKTLKMTPAMAAGLETKAWSHADLFYHLRERWPEMFLPGLKRMSA